MSNYHSKMNQNAEAHGPISSNLRPAEDIAPEELVGPYRLAPGEAWMKCPYDDHHVIRNTRYHIHLTKCRRIYVKTITGQTGQPPKEVNCRYNEVHTYFPPEIPEHEKECCDRTPYEYYAHKFNDGKLDSAEDYQYIDHIVKLANKEEELIAEKRLADLGKEVRANAEAKALKSVDMEDLELKEDAYDNDWENEETGQVFQYDPHRMESLDGNRMLLRPISGLCKSERRAIRRKYMIKFGYLTEDGMPVDPESFTSPFAPSLPTVDVSAGSEDDEEEVKDCERRCCIP